MEQDEIEKRLLDVLPALKCYALSLTGNEQRADDLLQDVVLNILSKRNCYFYNLNFKGWAMTIMHNIAINDSKRSSHCVYVRDNSFFDTPYCDTNADAREIKRFIGLLPSSFRVPFEMFVCGYRYCEIAEKIDVPVGTVKSRIHAARIRLRECFME